MRCHAAWVATNNIPAKLVEETVELWKSTQRGKALLPILDGRKKLFIRLDQMSPKDSPFGGKEPSTTFGDVVTKICSSMRAWKCLQNGKADAGRERMEMRIGLVLSLWDGGMDAGREFRAFVPPPAARGTKGEIGELRVSAISQYRWCFPFTHPFNFSLKHTAECRGSCQPGSCRKRFTSGANKVLERMKVFIEEEMSPEIRMLLVKYGFTFDIAIHDDGSVQLVEVNLFGALSGCRACLFNWEGVVWIRGGFGVRCYLGRDM